MGKSVMTAAMAAAAVIAAVVTLTVVVVMMVAADIGIEGQLTCQKSFYSGICIAGYAAKKLDACCCQRHLRAAADSAADEHIRIQSAQYTCQGTVTAAVGIYNSGGNHLSILYVIHFKLLGVAEMLENLSILIGNCDSHKNISFRYYKVGVSYSLKAGT